MQIDFQNKVVVITGAVGGLGSAMVQRFVEDGAKVAVCDLRGAVDSAKAYNKPEEVIGLDFDITDRAQVETAMNTIEEKLGKIDVLVNNAGINVGPDERKHVDEFSDKWWDAIIKVDLDGTYNCTQLQDHPLYHQPGCGRQYALQPRHRWHRQGSYCPGN